MGWPRGAKPKPEQEAEKHNEEPKEPPPRPGVIFEWEPAFEANDKLPATAIEEIVAEVNQQILSQELSLRLSATYVSPKSKGKPPAMEFVFDGKLRPGVPEFVAAKAAPQKDQAVVVLVLTPWYDMIR